MHYAASLCLSVALIYNGKAIHLQLAAYLMVTLNHNIKYCCKVFLVEKAQRNKGRVLSEVRIGGLREWKVERDKQHSAVV